MLSQNKVANSSLMHNFEKKKKLNQGKLNEQFSRKKIIVFVLKKCNTRGYQTVRRLCDEICTGCLQFL